MENKIQLTHPKGKKAIAINAVIYETLKAAILSSLRNSGPLTHKELLTQTELYINQNNIGFDGSVEWYMEWVKLDLEAHKQITRIDGTKPVRFRIGS